MGRAFRVAPCQRNRLGVAVMTPESENAFILALSKKIERATVETKNLRNGNDEYGEGYHDGYLDGLKWALSCFTGEP